MYDIDMPFDRVLNRYVVSHHKGIQKGVAIPLAIRYKVSRLCYHKGYHTYALIYDRIDIRIPKLGYHVEVLPASPGVCSGAGGCSHLSIGGGADFPKSSLPYISSQIAPMKL